MKTIRKNTNAYKNLVAKLQACQYEAKIYTLDNGFKGEAFDADRKAFWARKNIAEDISDDSVTQNDNGTITIRSHSNLWIVVTL